MAATYWERLIRPPFLGGLIVCALALISTSTNAETSDTASVRPIVSASAAIPGYCVTTHEHGKLYLSLSNFGRFSIGKEDPTFDCFTRKRLIDCRYPKGDGTMYLYVGGLWFGGVVGRDTLVSCGVEQNSFARELNPDFYPAGWPDKRSTLGATEEDILHARSEQDLVMVYTDTLVSGNPYPSFDNVSNRSHRPLGIEVRQESYVWSYGYADDFILFNLKITNISEHPIDDLYVGVFMDPDIHVWKPDMSPSMGSGSAYKSKADTDDEIGFMLSYPATYYDYCDFEDTIRMAWAADMDGDWTAGYVGNQYVGKMYAPNVTGIRFLRPPRENENFSFNWWAPNYNSIYDYGPQTREKFRNVGYGYGQPIGDRNKYFLMSNGEVDFSQPLTGRINIADPIWMPPSPSLAIPISKGAEGCYLMSLGPYDLDSWEQVEVPFAFIGGESLHVDPNNALITMRFGRYYPEWYLYWLNFAPMAANAAWAARIYDNPGIDTDEDGYAGKVRVCVMDSAFVDSQWVHTVVDSIYYEGDGVPDWKAETPPPSPVTWLTPTVGGVKVRFNGYKSETTRDFVSSLIDFEGYRVYVGRDDREASLALAASYDHHNYDIFMYNTKKKPKPGYELYGIPVTIRDIRCRFSSAEEPCADSSIHPDDHGLTNPYRSARYPDSVMYFAPHDNNVSRLGTDTPIRKRFPNEPRPDAALSVTPEMLTDDGQLKYYEYECEIPGLLPTVPYFVSVTAFDFGSPKVGLAPLESSKMINLESAYAASSADQLSDQLPPVYIYPNPYRVDDNYRLNGYEGRGHYERINDRVRAIHFVNVPAKCTIRIHSLDGDLVRELHHDVDPSDPKCHHATWDMISRNVQMIVSGLYYWSVEDERGEVQIGKLVVIM